MSKTQHDSETPANGHQVFSACAFIHHEFDGEQKVFLAKRADTKKFLPGVYELPGGHIDYGEDIVDGLKRELKEEFGVETDIADPFYVFTYTNDIKGSHSIEVIYFAKLTTDIQSIVLDPEDHSTSGWFAESELINATTATKGLDDIEFKAMKKGFALLRGEPLKF